MKDIKRQPKIKFDGESEEKLPLRPAIVGKDVSRVKYEGIQVPRIVKRSSNLSVEPQYGSDSDIRMFKKRNFLHPRKKQAGIVLFLYYFCFYAKGIAEIGVSE